MLIVTTDTIPGKKIEVLGLVNGSTIQSAHIGKDIGASFRTLVGGEVKGYSEMMDRARRQATERMFQQAQNLGADAIVAVRFGSASVMQNAAEVLAYGTAVRYVEDGRDTDKET